MKEIITVTSGKGGVGKTTALVNLASALSAMGMKVLIVDTDPQGSATGYFDITYAANGGFVEMVENADRDDYNPADYISHTDIPNLDLVYHSKGAEPRLKAWLGANSNYLQYLRFALSRFTGEHDYDYVFIDTMGSYAPYSGAEMALRAATMYLSPMTADWLSSRTFYDTLEMFNSVAPIGVNHPQASLPIVHILLWKIDNTNDHKHISNLILQKDSETFLSYCKISKHKLSALQTVVPQRAVFNGATGAKMPVHVYEKTRTVGEPASDLMLAVIHELLPEMRPFSFEHPFVRK